MDSEGRLRRFSLKGIFTFLLIVCGSNIVFVPVLTALGIRKDISLFISTSISASMALTIVLTYIDAIFKERKPLLKCFLFSLAGCSALSYLLIYLTKI
ncbi:hypothetical protein WD019_13905 [Fictibacillus sp. Mic-4]|uniref:hypothetical protein n=1 Tax=Fictibacillus TaxID=1329200 RepID=UPI0003FCDF61|nr:hypothetical protein [Fictibacillus gelatini]